MLISEQFREIKDYFFAAKARPCSLRFPRRNNATCFGSKAASKIAAISSATGVAIVS